jgi:hypothetical protein
MPIPHQEKVPRLQQLRELLEADATKLALSALIILSVLPFSFVERASLAFFAVFAAELAVRVALLREQLREGRLSRIELVVLLLDLIATLSFLPLEGVFEVRFLRLIRLSRMLLLLSYWSPVGKEIWVILSKRERRYQLLFVASMVVLLTFTAGVLLYHVGPAAIDYDENGKLDHPGFWTLVWWSFRQLQDPGNLVKTPSATFAFVLSLVLTLAGIFVVTFLIGIGTSVVRELVDVGRERRLGLRSHSLITSLSPHSRMLVEELVAYYKKSFRSPRLATMGPAPARYDYMYADSLRTVRYRQGLATSMHDLHKVDGDRARRVILLGDGEHNLADAEVVSQILTVQRLNQGCRIFAELVRPDNLRAALSAGGPNTVPVLAHRLISLLLADLLTYPGVERVYDQLLSSRGHEIYTCYFGVGAMEEVQAPEHPLGSFEQLSRRLHQRHGALLLGWSEGDPYAQPRHVIAPAPGAKVPAAPTLCGLIALAPNFERLADGARRLARERAESAPEKPQAPGAESPGPSFEPQRQALKRLLICGYHEGLADLCAQLLLFCPSVRITVLVPTQAQLQRLQGQLGQPTSSAADVAGVRVFATDWSEGDELSREREGFALRDAEAILLTYTASDADPDGRSALALLKLVDLRDHQPSALHPQLRIVCEVLDSAKAELLERRFAGEVSASCGERPLVVISAERLRHALLAQAVFVPGSDAIYSELLGHGGPELVKLLPRELPPRPAGDPTPVTFDDLLGWLADEQQIPIAIELRDRPQLVINPGPQAAGYTFELEELAAVFVLGQPTEGASGNESLG